MKHVKKLTIAIITLVFVITSTISTIAAITTNQTVVNALKNTGKLPAVYVIGAQNYLRTKKLTKAQSTAIISDINKASSIMKQGKTKDITKLSSAKKAALLQSIKHAAKQLKLTVYVKKKSKTTYYILFKDSKGKTVWALNSKYLKQN